MNIVSRMTKYVWPYRRKVYLSLLFAICVAFFWGANISACYPVVKVLLQGQDLNEYILQEITVTEELIVRTEEKIANLENSSELDDVERLHQVNRSQRKLSGYSRSLFLLNWVQQNIIRWLPSDQFRLLALVLLLFLAGTFIKSVCLFIQDYLIKIVVESSITDIRKDCFQKTLELDYQTVTLQGTPELMSRFTFDLNTVAVGLQVLGGRIIREPLKALVCVGFAFMVNWRLTLMSFFFVPVTGFVFYKIGKKLKKASHLQMESMSRLYKHLEETFDAIKVVFAFGGEKRHQEQFAHENDKYLKKALQIGKIESLSSPLTECLGIIAAFAALFPGAYMVLNGTKEVFGIQLAAAPLDIAELGLLYALLIGTLDPVRKLSSVYPRLKRASAGAERIFQLLDQTTLVTETDTPKTLERLSRELVFKNITFHYAQHTDDPVHRSAVLNDVDLKVKAGETILLVGENGSGKSTLLNLLPRFFDPDSGEITIDEVEIRETSLDQLRRQISMVSQETLLFDTTIVENIRYGNPEATLGEVEEAAGKAYVTDFVKQFPEGLETKVGEKGSRLSGGQRQRVALARAMLRDPALLLLDEATSAIDSKSEQLINEALTEFVKGRTTLMVSHSVSQSLLEFVTRVVVMKQGEIIAMGTHEELIGTCPLYKLLFRDKVNLKAA